MSVDVKKGGKGEKHEINPSYHQNNISRHLHLELYAFRASKPGDIEMNEAKYARKLLKMQNNKRDARCRGSNGNVRNTT